MSETDNANDLDDAEFDEPPADPEPEAVAPKTTRKISWANVSIAWLALFLALGGVAGVGYILVERIGDEESASATASSIDALAERIDNTGDATGEVSNRVDSLAAAASRTDAAIAALRSDVDGRTELYDSLPPRLSALERAVAGLQGVSVDARNIYLIAEAEYYLQIANAQLQLAGNAYLASLALVQADDRIVQLADPALTDVRRAIADELAALEIMEKPDVAGASLTLASLARIVDSLPIRTASQTEPDTDADEAGEPGFLSRVWSGIKAAASGLVRVSRPDDDQIALMTPEVESLARTNLSLQLQAARLALLRNEQAVFESALDDAIAWLGRYFDVSSDAVSNARETLAGIREDYSGVAAPDISGSLRLLRQYKTLHEPGRALIDRPPIADAPAEDEVPAAEPAEERENTESGDESADAAAAVEPRE